VKDDDHTDRFSVDINDGKAATAAKAMKQGVIVEVTGKLRHDRWKDKATNRWTGKVFIAVDPGEGSVRSKGMAQAPVQEAARGLSLALTPWCAGPAPIRSSRLLRGDCARLLRSSD
jgi:single-stranded DNA-binding protein